MIFLMTDLNSLLVFLDFQVCFLLMVSGVTCNKSVTHRLKNIDTKIETCGTPNSDVKRVEEYVQHAVEKLNECIFCITV